MIPKPLPDPMFKGNSANSQFSSKKVYFSREDLVRMSQVDVPDTVLVLSGQCNSLLLAEEDCFIIADSASFLETIAIEESLATELQPNIAEIHMSQSDHHVVFSMLAAAIVGVVALVVILALALDRRLSLVATLGSTQSVKLDTKRKAE